MPAIGRWDLIRRVKVNLRHGRPNNSWQKVTPLLWVVSRAISGKIFVFLTA